MTEVPTPYEVRPDTLDNFIKQMEGMGFMRPAGQLLSSVCFPDLYNMIGRFYSNHDDDPLMFRLPDMRANVFVVNGEEISYELKSKSVP